MSPFQSQNGRIVVEQPNPGDTIAGGVEVLGESDTYEATVMIEVVDAHGTVVGRAIASGGTMGLAPFKANVAFEGSPSSAEGSLRVSEAGGRDGVVTEMVTIPVRFAQ